MHFVMYCSLNLGSPIWLKTIIKKAVMFILRTKHSIRDSVQVIVGLVLCRFLPVELSMFSIIKS